jgi:hypothetical protein
VVDSISRTIDTDSLYRIYRGALKADNPEPLFQQAGCEQARLYRRYGSMPARAAVERMEDTLWKAHERAAVIRMAARLPSTVVLSGRHCERAVGAGAPEYVGDTPLDTRTDRPMPRRRPRL